jgi:DNA-binding CsgD family transcriptional regulator
MTTADVLERGRDAFFRRAWVEAYTDLTSADAETPLAIEDLERLAIVCGLIGRDEESTDAWGRAHHENLRLDDPGRAARCAFWLGMGLFNRGEHARGGGWIARAQRVLDEHAQDCVERGYLLVPGALQRLEQGEPEAALAAFERAAEFAKRFSDADLIALGTLGRGVSLIRLGQAAAGGSLLDEVMIAATADELSPIVTGIVYCAVIDACQETFDLRRAQEWTAALNTWCSAQADLVPFRGQCLVHRAEIMQLHGAWTGAMDEARRACERLAGQPLAGAAFYRQAELARLRGQFSRAEEAYRQASQCGHGAQPGLARMRLFQGNVAAAGAAIRRALDEAADRASRAKLLPAFVEIMVAANDVPAARLAADELSGIANELQAPFLFAASADANGAVRRAEGDPRAGLVAARQAWRRWLELGAPYEAARSRTLIALACRELGDEEAAEMELAAARASFQQLGATPDIAWLDALATKAPSGAPSGLTAREIEVLRLVAAGKTNRSIAAVMFISEKTVARHVSNIFAKLGVSSRAAATAYAYEHELVEPASTELPIRHRTTE